MNNRIKIIILYLINSLLLTLCWAYIDFKSVSSTSYPSNTFIYDSLKLLICLVLLFLSSFFFKRQILKKKLIYSAIITLVSLLTATITLLSLGESFYLFFSSE